MNLAAKEQSDSSARTQRKKTTEKPQFNPSGTTADDDLKRKWDRYGLEILDMQRTTCNSRSISSSLWPGNAADSRPIGNLSGAQIEESEIALTVHKPALHVFSISKFFHETCVLLDTRNAERLHFGADSVDKIIIWDCSR